MLWHTRFVITNLAGITRWLDARKSAPRTAPTGSMRCNATGVTPSSAWSGAGSRGSWIRRCSGGSRRCWRDWFFRAAERVDQPAQPRRGCQKSGTVFDAGGNRAAQEMVSLRSRLKIHDLTADKTPRVRAHAGLAEAVLDPYVNAVHVSLLREKQLNPDLCGAFAADRRRHRRGARLWAKNCWPRARKNYSPPSACWCWPIKG